MKRLATIGALILSLALGVFVFVQYLRSEQLAEERSRLRREAREAKVELEEAATIGERLNRSNQDLKAKTSEIARLRAEVARLKQDLAQAERRAQEASQPAPEPEEAPRTHASEVREFTGAAEATLAPGQTLVFGGWSMVPGKRVMALVTPEVLATVDNEQILIVTKFLSVSESLLSDASWTDFLAADAETSGAGVFDPGQADSFVTELQAQGGVEVLSAPRVTALAGQEAMISSGSAEGGFQSITLLPRLGPDGQTVELSATASLSQDHP